MENRAGIGSVSFPWDPIMRKDAHEVYLTLEVIKLVFEYQRRLRRVVLEYLNRNVFLIEPDLSEGTKTIPYQELFNAIETNLRNLVAADMTIGMEFTKIWHGGLRDEKFLDYTDVNRWFETMQLLHRYIMSIQKRYYTANAFYLGMYPSHQAVGIPQRKERDTFAFTTQPRRGWQKYVLLEDGVLLNDSYLME